MKVQYAYYAYVISQGVKVVFQGSYYSLGGGLIQSVATGEIMRHFDTRDEWTNAR